MSYGGDRHDIYNSYESKIRQLEKEIAHIRETSVPKSKIKALVEVWREEAKEWRKKYHKEPYGIYRGLTQAADELEQLSEEK